MAHGLVPEITHQAAAKPQGRRNRRRLVPLQPGAQIRVRVGVLQALHADIRAAGVAHDTPHRRAVRRGGCHYSLAARQPDEGIAAEALAADAGFQKIRIGAVRELRVERERGIEIGARLGEHRNAGVALRGEPLKFELSHETLSNSCTGGNCFAAWVGRGPEPRGDASGLAAPAAPATPGEGLELCREGLHGGSDYTTAPSRARMSRMVAA